jgi:hypothetical protein
VASQPARLVPLHGVPALGAALADKIARLRLVVPFDRAVRDASGACDRDQAVVRRLAVYRDVLRHGSAQVDAFEETEDDFAAWRA